MGGAALHLGNIAEMKTGEGKTLTGVLPAYLNALAGQGVHVVTVNDYLAKRDSEWMGRIHRFLGLEVGVILADMEPDDAAQAVRRRHHLRHQQRVRLRLPARQHGLGPGGVRPARAPLRDRGRGRLDPHRRGPDPADHQRPGRPEQRLVPGVRRASCPGCGAARTARATTRSTRRSGPSASLEAGVEKVEDWLGIDNLYESVNTPLVSFLNNALKAKELYKKDKDYVVIERRGPDRRRVHRPHPARPPVQRGHAPGHRGQGGRDRSRTRTRRSPRSRCRTTSGCTTSWPA